MPYAAQTFPPSDPKYSVALVQGTAAARPAAGNLGDGSNVLYFATDTGDLAVAGRGAAAWSSLRGVDANALAAGDPTIPRSDVVSNVAAAASGTLLLTYFTARRAATYSKLRAVTGGTAAGATPTLCRLGVYTVAANGNLTLAQACASDTTLFAAANTKYEKALAAALTVNEGDRLAFGILVVSAAATPTFAGRAMFNAVMAAELGAAPRLSATLAGQTDLPGTVTAGTLTDSANLWYGVLVP